MPTTAPPNCATTTYLAVDLGHNDLINDGGDYLASNHGCDSLFTLYATNNYWQTPGGHSPDDFYPTGSANYTPGRPCA